MQYLLKLRITLLSNYPYFIVLFLTLLVTIFRINVVNKSIYNKTSTNFSGYIEKYNVDGNVLTLTIKNKEKLIGTYYFKTKKEKDNFLKNIKLGIKIKGTGEFNKPKESTIDNIFSYKDYLYRKNIFYLVKISEYKIINNNEPLYYKLKNKIYNHLKNKKTEPYLKTFILGDKSSLKENIKENYQYLGISHLFAISGMHITFLSGIILLLLKKLKIEETKRYLIVMILLMIYLLLVGLSSSVLRAVIFFYLFSINKIYYFYIKPLNIFYLTLSISLLINPYFIYDVGFLYSFSISFSLIYFSNILNKPKHYISKLLMTSIISFLISIPISLYNFYQINTLSIIYNLFYVPLITIIIFPLSLLTFIFPLLDNILFIFINILESSTNILTKIPIGVFIFPKLNIIYYIIIFIFIIIVIKYRKKLLYLVLILIFIVHYFYMIIINNSFMIMLDVGQGDSSIFLSKGKTMLVDTGGITTYTREKWQQKQKETSIVKSKTIPYLKSLGIKKIDYLVLTHGDYDHLGETLNLLQNIKVDKIFINEGKINYLENLISKKHKVKKLKQDDIFTLGDFNIYSLNKNLKEENDSSLVLYIENNNTKILMMGDATSKSEKEILNNYSLNEIDILKVGHHGSDTSSSKDFINVINPKNSLISVGENNKYGHPKNSVLKTLSKSKIYRTDKSGSIIIKINKKGYIIKESKFK